MQLKKFSNTNFQRLKPAYYHLTARTAGDEYFSVPMPKAWEQCLGELKRVGLEIRFDIIAFVLMNNHYHLLVKANESELLKLMYEFKPLGLNHIKKDQVISKRYLFHTYRYIYQNPLRAGLVKRIEDYPYSFLKHLSRGEKLPFPIHDRFGHKDEYVLHKLNQDYVV